MQCFKSCIGCTKRYPGCHSKCEDYLKGREELNEINEIKRANRGYADYVANKITKYKKKETIRKRTGGHK